MKIEINVFIEQVKDEILCYEDMEKVARNWEAEFLIWIEQNKKHKDVIKTSKGEIGFTIGDEGEIFEIADSYIEAVEEGTQKKYWEKF